MGEERLRYALTSLWVLPAVLAVLLVIGARRLPPPSWAFVAFLIVMPAVYAFGSNTNYWNAQARAGIFWLVGLVIVIAHLQPRAPRLGPLPWLCATLAIVAAFSAVTVLRPYRTSNLLLATHRVAVGEASHVRLSADAAKTFASLADARARLSLNERLPILDLTGDSPGYLYALSGRAAGQGWVIGGYPGSSSAAAAVVANIPCQELRRAWVLRAPSNPRAIDARALRNSGINLLDYSVAFQFERPNIAWMGAPAGRVTVDLLAPSKESARRPCP